MNYHYPLICVIFSGLIGCSSVPRVNHEDQANNQTTAIIEQLVNRTIDQTPSSADPENKLDKLTDLVNLPQLTAYIDEALQSNPSLQQSIIALSIAYANQGISRADLLPSVTGSFTGQNEESSDQSYTSDLTVSWELDIWKRLADTNNAAKTDILASQADLLTAKNLLVSNIMRGWLEISANQQLLNIEKRRLAVLSNNETLILDRYQTGLGTLEELDNARTSTAQTKATIADYQNQLAQSKRSLLLLTGGWNEKLTDIKVDRHFPKVLYPLDNMSVQNLSGRPDLRKAFLDIKSQALRTDAAYKAMLPSFSLSASLAEMAETPSEALFKNPLWSLLGQISAPLFQGGLLKSEAKVARLTTEQNYWAYQETLLTAVNEVENAIGSESALAAQQRHLTTALTSAKRSVVSYEQNYRDGLSDIFELLTVQQQAFDAQSSLISTIYERLLNRIELGLALGLGVSS